MPASEDQGRPMMYPDLSRINDPISDSHEADQIYALSVARSAITVVRRRVEESVPNSRERSMVLTKLDEALLWLGAIERGYE